MQVSGDPFYSLLPRVDTMGVCMLDQFMREGVLGELLCVFHVGDDD